MSPPTKLNACPVNRVCGTGAPRGKKYGIVLGTLTALPNAPERGWVRVMTEDTVTLKKGDLIPARLRYALESPNGQRIPIFENDLHDWLDAYFAPGLNKSGQRAAYARDGLMRKMWACGKIGTVPLRRGAWRIVQSDEAVVIIPQMHTQPLAKLTYSFTPRGTPVARFITNETTPAAAQFGDRNSYEGPTETTTN